MDANSHPLRQPTWRETEDGEQRRVGVELEMGGLSLDELARVAARFLGATVERRSDFERCLRGDPAGDWQAELDFRLLKNLGRQHAEAADQSPRRELVGAAEEILRALAEPVVPVELVSPPLPLDRLPEVEGLIRALRAAGATGTSEHLLHAFAMQLNPEIPSPRARVVTAYLKAFLCLHDWLRADAHVDISRSATAYIDPFPREYVRQVVDPGYWPDIGALIDDYLRANPTRNRALDFLPLFLHLDPARVRRHTDDRLIKARPALHYRLPNCQIQNPDWGLHRVWNPWVEVERLAADEARLMACCQAYSRLLEHPIDSHFGRWRREVEARWLAR